LRTGAAPCAGAADVGSWKCERHSVLNVLDRNSSVTVALQQAERAHGTDRTQPFYRPITAVSS
jgi:hypothetical protein